MHPQLQRALEPVLRDLRATTGTVPARIEADDWADSPDRASAMIWSQDGSGVGVQVQLDTTYVDQVVQVTDQVQEWAVEELWGSAPTNWPPCPLHPTTHPLEVTSDGGTARWTCPRSGVPMAEVGTLG